MSPGGDGREGLARYHEHLASIPVDRDAGSPGIGSYPWTPPASAVAARQAAERREAEHAAARREEDSQRAQRENRAGGAEVAPHERDAAARAAIAAQVERERARDEAIMRVRNEAQGIDREPATISREEARARAAGEVILPDIGRATSYDEDQARAQAMLARAQAEAARDRAERADPVTAPWVEARDWSAAAGRFPEADSTQRLIDATRADQARHSAEQREQREREDREAPGRGSAADEPVHDGYFRLGHDYEPHDGWVRITPQPEQISRDEYEDDAAGRRAARAEQRASEEADRAAGLRSAEPEQRGSDDDGYAQAAADDRADALDAKAREDALEHDHWDADTQAYWRDVQAANQRSIESKAQDDRLRAQAWERNRPLREAEAEAARDQHERNDPDTAGMVQARDHQAAGGRFDDADATQRLIDAETRRAAERAERRQVEDRETDAQLRHDRFPFWADRDRPEPGPTDRAALIERAHQMQGQTRDRAHYRTQSRDQVRGPMVGRTRGREELQR